MNDTTRNTGTTPPQRKTHLTALSKAFELVEGFGDLSSRVRRSLNEVGQTQYMVRLFHILFERPAPLKKRLLSVSTRELRLRLILEEFQELIVASGYQISAPAGSTDFDDGLQTNFQLDHVEGSTQDYIEMADALADIVYVCFGMAVEMGLDLNEVIREVHASNLTKLGADGNPIINECKHYGGDKKLGLDFESRDPSAVEISMCHNRERFNKCDDPSHRPRPDLPAGKVLKGPGYMPPQLSRILHDAPPSK